jgi:hypothetical protein
VKGLVRRIKGQVRLMRRQASVRMRSKIWLKGGQSNKMAGGLVEAKSEAEEQKCERSSKVVQEIEWRRRGRSCENETTLWK